LQRPGPWTRWFLLRNYRHLNEAKFVVINKIEAEHLPVKPFLDEWVILSGGETTPSLLGKVRARHGEASCSKDLETRVQLVASP
jgi:hypothetical protein